VTGRPRLSRLIPFLLAFGLCGLTTMAGAQTDSADSAPPAAPPTAPDLPLASGTVFEDRNGNRRRDPGEPGLAGVLVSNGLEVVRSGLDGRYSLPIAEGDVLFVTKPAGYAPPVDRDMAPQFHYVHDPDGTPTELGLRFGSVAPTGPLPAAIDFPFDKVTEPDAFKVIWFADTQAQTPAELDYLRDDVIAELVGTEAAFGVTAGDVVYDDLTLYPRHNRLVGRIGIPWYNLPGNHDLNFLSPDDRHSLETFKRTFGPTYYSFDYGRVHFVMLDSVVYHGRNAGRAKPNAWGAGTYEGRISQRQLAWLANDLSFVPEDRLVVVGMHIQLDTPGEDGQHVNVANRAALFELLSGRRRVFSIAGHLQNVLHRYFGAEDGYQGPAPLHQHVIAAASGGWWSGPPDPRGIPIALQGDGTPNGYYIMSVHGTEVVMRYKAASLPADHQMRITVAPVFEHPSLGPAAPQDYNDTPIPRARLAAMELVVNLFDGGPKSKVWFSIDGGPAVAMARSARVDALVAKLSLRIKDRSVFWTPLRDSTHIWAAPLPRDLAPGVRRITIRAVDEYGQEHRGTKLIEIVP